MENTPISERITQARYYSRYIKLTVIHVYTPTDNTEEQAKDELYTRLQDVIHAADNHDMIIITGDMNA